MSISVLKNLEGVHVDKDRGPYITTYTGLQFYPLDPQEVDVCLDDIVHALANQCRFSGHTSQHFSVLQHSYNVGLYILNTTQNKYYALHGLMHDASEAYLVDLPRPLKKLESFYAYRTIEKNVQDVINKKFGIEGHLALVKDIDNLMLTTEARDLMGNPPWCHDSPKLEERIVPKSPGRVKNDFYKLFDLCYDEQKTTR